MVFYDPSIAEHLTLRNSVNEVPEDNHQFEIVFADGSNMSFEGFVTSANFTGAENASELKLECEVRIDGGLTYSGGQ